MFSIFKTKNNEVIANNAPCKYAFVHIYNLTTPIGDESNRGNSCEKVL